jgi:phage recombination protein Bet
MSAITTTSQSSIQHFNPEQMKVLQEQLAPKCSPSELQYFIEVCKITGLSPFTREIYAISRNNWNPETGQNEPKMTIQVSIDGLRKRAANTGLYDGSATYWCGDDAVWVEVWLKNTLPSAAKTIVYRKGSQPFVAVARFDSYKQEYKNKKTQKMELSGQWAKMPDLMIGKVSEALALRKAFPEQTAGLYSGEEMDQIDSESKPVYSQSLPVQPQPVQQTAGWDKELWAIFEKGVNKCATIEELEKLIGWVSKTVNKYQPSQEQDQEIWKIIDNIKDRLNNGISMQGDDIPKPVKSAQVQEQFAVEDVDIQKAVSRDEDLHLDALNLDSDIPF